MTQPISSPINWTRSETWYDENADMFEIASLDMPPTPLLLTFASMIGQGARVLDAGCGVGRDTRWLLDQGFDVSAFDISREMVEATYGNTLGRVKPRRLDFRDYDDPPNSWNGIWALASLLHLPRHEVAAVLPRLLTSLTPDGLLAFSVKQGQGEEMDARGRPVSYFEPVEVSNMVYAALPVGGFFETRLVRLPDSSGHQTTWIDVIAGRSQPS
jgi:SAM-dependent methyltransferase